MESMEPLLVAYSFTALVVGTSCVGAAMVLARLRHDDLARLFLWFYLPCSVLVLSGLVLAFVDLQAVSPATLSVLEYFEGFVGRYGVMFALPLFVHRLFDVRSRRRDAMLVGIVLVTLVAQHVTELGLGGSVWDGRGDTVEDAVKSIGNAGFKCPCCGSVSKNPYKCNSGVVVENLKGGKSGVCDWKAYGLLGTLGKGVTIFIKEKLALDHIFKPVEWSE